MASGPNQHYLPRFLQEPFGIRPKRKEIWVFARDASPEKKRLKKVGASEYFYSDPAPEGIRTLDDDITAIETHISRKLASIRAQPIGTLVDSANAAEIVSHLVPRTAHVRVNMERGLRAMARGIDTILGDDDRVRSLMGLNEEEPSEVFKTHLENKLDEIKGIENLGLPSSLIQRIAFILAKENFTTLAADVLPMMRNVFRSWLETSNGLAREAHNKTLEKVSGSSPHLRLLEDLNWTIQPAPSEGAILPDCSALAVDQFGQVTPAMFSDWKQASAIILPIAPDKLLVGATAKYDFAQLRVFNEVAARSSHNFFLASTTDKYFADLHDQLGERSTQLIEEVITGAIEPYLTIMPKPMDHEAPAFPIDLINQVSEPWQYELSFIGCGDDAAVHELSRAVQGIIKSLAQALPLNRLDGITVAADYRAALASIDLGYESDSVLGTAPEEIGQGIARTVTVRRDGRWKERLIVDARIAFALLAEESETVDWGSYTLVRQLSEVAISEMIERHLPDVWTTPISDPLHSFLYPSVHPAIFAYLGSHMSAGFSDPLHEIGVKRELFIAALSEMKSAGATARLEYRYDGDLDRLLGIVMPRISYTLQFAADLLGHCTATGVDPFDADGELSAALTDAGLKQWFPIFGDRLEHFRIRLGQWASFDEFLALDAHVERLMWQLGMLPWHGPSGLRIEIPLGTDIEKLTNSTRH